MTEENRPNLRRLFARISPLCLVVFFLLVPLGEVSRAQQANNGLTMQVAPTFEGNFKNGEWLAVWVEVENQGSDLDTEIQIAVESGIGATTYASALSLPSNSRKRIPVYVRPNSYTRELTVQLFSTASGDPQNQLLLEQKTKVDGLINQNLMVGLVAAERGPLSMMQEIEFFDNQRELSLVDVRVSDLPAKPEVYRSLDVLIINDVDTSTLEPEQSEALASWVSAGGHLILGGGGNAARTLGGLPETLRPQLNGSPIEIAQADTLVAFAAKRMTEGETVDEIKVAGPFVAQWAAYSSSTSLGNILAGNEATPFVVQFEHGSGTVQYSALSLTDSPFNAWSGNTDFLGALLKQQGVRPEWLPPDVSLQQMRSFQIASALSQLPTLNLPSIRWLGILLGLYILLVGPVNYLLLRQFRRLHWAWLTIPLLTITFAAGTFGTGYALRGTDLILNHIAIIEPSASGTSQVANYVGLFSPAEQSYDIEIDSNSLISPISQDADPFMSGPMRSPVGTTGDMTIVNGATSQIRNFAVSQWAMQSFQTENSWDNFGTIASELRLNGANVVGEVRNETDITLQDIVVVLGEQYQLIGDMPAGSSSDVELKLTGLGQNDFGSDIWWHIYRNNGSGLSNNDGEIKYQIAQGLFGRNLGWSPEFQPAKQGILMLGWIDDVPLSVQISGRTPTRQVTGLVHTKVPLVWPESGSLTIPPYFIGATLTKYPINGGQCDSPNSLHMSSGSAEMQFELPEEKMFSTIEALELKVGYDYGPEDLPTTIEFYDWVAGDWQDGSELSTITKSADNAVPLINERGQVRIRVTANREFTNGCGRFDLSVTGEL